MRGSTLLCLCLLAGCGRPQVKDDAGERSRVSASGRDVALEVHTAATGDLAVAPGATLKSQTQLSLRVEVSQPSYVFIGQRSGDGTVEVIYPAETESARIAEPRQPLLVPGPGAWFRLDDRTGDKALFMVSLPTPDRAMAQQLLVDMGEAACLKARDPPPPDVRLRDRVPAVRGTADATGRAILCFPYYHR